MVAPNIAVETFGFLIHHAILNDAVLIQQKIKRYTAPAAVPAPAAIVKDSTSIKKDSLKTIPKPIVKPQ